MPVILYGLVLFGTIAIAFAVYTMVMLGWRTSHHQLSRQELSNPADHKSSVSLNLNPYSASTFKYKKRIENSEVPSETECIVCLSDFEDDEYVRQLPRCKHSFHASCIDMWVYSHSDCPLCRTPIHRLDSESSVLTIENSFDGLLDTRSLSSASNT
ncbi:conserved hypothetical protein [Ricinus communis]|uniref:RING-type domain-containing protein n=1 Tax=Ricinus communis TaxID=3988 RepID=B9S5S5_RICCO|nr:conserved hypothetical protein [Ricinus communis]